jgi:hypothetical protein
MISNTNLTDLGDGAFKIRESFKKPFASIPVIIKTLEH